MCKFNRHLIYGRIKYNMFCDSPCYELHRHGYSYLLNSGFHPDTNSWIEEWQEGFLLDSGLLKCISLPTIESRYDQLNYEMLYMSILG